MPRGVMLAGVVLCAFGLGFGLASARDSRPAPAPAKAHATPGSRVRPQDLDCPVPRPTADGVAARRELVAEIAAEMREVVRSELSAHQHDARAGEETPAAAPRDPAREEERRRDQEAAAASGRDLVSDAAASGVWAEEDAAALGELLPRMRVDQRQEVLQSLFARINRGELVVDAPDALVWPGGP